MVVGAEGLIAGGFGSVLRYLTDNALPTRIGQQFAWGTALVNLLGSLGIGIITGVATTWLAGPWTTILGVGVLGGYTTFSTASVETVHLFLDRRCLSAALYGIGTFLDCLIFALRGLLITTTE